MQVIALDPGFIEVVQHQTLEDMSGFRARVRDVPADLEARVGLARSLLECGQLDEAFLHLRLANVSGGQRGQASYLMGLAHIWSGDDSTAVDDLLLAVRLLPDSAPALAALHTVLAGSAAAPIARRAEPSEPNTSRDQVTRVYPPSSRFVLWEAA